MGHVIELRDSATSPVPDAVCIGTIDGEPLSYVGRQPYRGTKRLDPTMVNWTMVGAAEVAGRAVFGAEWIQSLARATGINSRTLARDRTGSHGMPLPALYLLSRAASYEVPRAIGYALLAMAEVRIKLSQSGRGTRVPKPDELIAPVGEIFSAAHVLYEEVFALRVVPLKNSEFD